MQVIGYFMPAIAVHTVDEHLLHNAD